MVRVRHGGEAQRLTGVVGALLIGTTLLTSCAQDAQAPAPGPVATERFDFGAVVTEVRQDGRSTQAVLKSATSGEAYVVLDIDHVASRGRYTVTGAGELNVTGESAGALTEAELTTSSLEAAQKTYSLWQGSIDFLGQGGTR